MTASEPCLDNHKAMAPEARSKCAPIREREYPLSVSLASLAPCRTACRICDGCTWIPGCTKLMGVVNGMPCAIMALTIATFRADGAEVGIHSFLVDDVAALPILLIIHYERHRGGGCKDSFIAGGREQSLALPKTDVTDTKLHSAYCAVPWWEHILADAQKKVK